MARDGEAVVGVVRTCDEDGHLVLRGLFVDEAWRGRGIGSRLRDAAADGVEPGRACWCIPFRHLEAFYARAGFRRVSETEAPPFLVERLARYRSTGADVVLTCRPPDADAARVDRRRWREAETS